MTKDFEFLGINMKSVVKSGKFTIMVGSLSNNRDLLKLKLVIS